MEPAHRTGIESSNSSQPTFERQKPTKPSNKIKKILKFIKRFWYVFVVLAIVIGVLIAWGVASAREDAAWQRANDAFGKADYETAKKEIGGYGMPTDEARLKVYAQTMLATRTLDKALEGYEKLYVISKDQGTLLILGNVYNQQGDYDKAISTYKEVISNNSGNIQAYVNLATVYKLKNEQDKAITTAKEAVDKNPKSVVALELLVSMLLDDKNSDDYKKAVEQLKAINPDDPLLQAINA